MGNIRDRLKRNSDVLVIANSLDNFEEYENK